MATIMIKLECCEQTTSKSNKNNTSYLLAWPYPKPPYKSTVMIVKRLLS